MGDTGGFRRQIGGFRILVLVLLVILIAVAISFAVVTLNLKNELASGPKPCSSSAQTIDLDPPESLPPFHDLTKEEIMAVRDYLFSQSDLNLVTPDKLETNTSYIYTFELSIPNKEMTLNYLDSGKTQPPREAKVVIFRGDKPETYIEEYVVGPLPTPIYKKNHKTIPFRYRPFTTPELTSSTEILTNILHASKNIRTILAESYGGKLKGCENTCLTFHLATPVSSANTGEPRSRKMLFWLYPDVEFFSLHPLDFFVLMDLTSNKADEYKIEKLYYGGQMFMSVKDIENAYEFGSVRKTRIPYPVTTDELFSSMHRRGTEFPESPQAPPTEFEPNGHRYSIAGRHVSYMGWDFDVRMSTLSGPQLFDIKYQNKRIVYELSLQEIAVYYSGYNPASRFSDFLDSVTLIGPRSRSLIAGVDCPKHSTYLSANHVLETMDQPFGVDRAFCVFEHNTGMPLRRHLKAENEYGPNKFYEGMPDVVLIVRTIATITNYDYIFDFIFHQNGVVQVKAVSTGYILSSYQTTLEDSYGFRLRSQLTGNMHHHMFNFKVDMDINGRQNRFETIDITPVDVDNSKWSSEPNARYSQTKMVRQQVQTETQAAIKHDFNTPKYLTFYNNDHKSTYGVPRAYRLMIKGMSKQLLKEGQGQEPSISWARYQLAVTKYKETEKRSSSVYGIWDAGDPVVNFQSFIDDDETISDEDQVAWVTMGMHHIPHMEDFPVTSTTGLDLQFLLLPNNYFDEDPAMGSSDAVRIEPLSPQNLQQGLKINRYGRSLNSQCIPRQSTFDNEVTNNPEVIFNK